MARKHKLPSNRYDFGSILKGGLTAGGGALANQIGYGLLSNGLSTGAGSAISNIGNTVGGIVSNIPGVGTMAGPIIQAASGIIGGAVNGLWGSKLNEEVINDIKSVNTGLSTLQLDDSSTLAAADAISNINFGGNFTKSDVGRDGLLAHKAADKYNELRALREAATANARSAMTNAASNANASLDLSIMLNYKADGGSIHIKPSKRGTFTKAATQRGMGVLEFASKVLSNPDNYSEAMRKKALFAKNAKSWKHAFGGNLITNGDLFSNNGLVYIGNGGTHQENPFEGVLMGVDELGTPNLVEEGEVLFNDYVFSNRLKVPKSIRNKYKLGGVLSYADAAKVLAKESEERPNDPISKNGLMAWANDLIMELEMQRSKKLLGNRFDYGGMKDIQDIVNWAKDWNIGLPTPELTRTDLNNLQAKTRIRTEERNNNTSINKLKGFFTNPENLRYAPILGSALGVISDLTGLTNRPDYTRANNILAAALGTTEKVTPKYIDTYIEPTIKGIDDLINPLNALAASTRSAITQNAAGNVGTAMANLLASDLNYLNAIGDARMKIYEYNNKQRQDAAEFNRATQLTNANLDLEAQKLNIAGQQWDRQFYADAVNRAATLMDLQDLQASANRSANLTGLFENMGNLGIDIANRRDRDALVKSGVFGILSLLMEERLKQLSNG